MKKLFISCPMKGRTKEAIELSMLTMHQVAELMFGEELEVIDTMILEEPPVTKDKRLRYLGKSIQRMADADCFIGVWCDFAGCEVECEAARVYDIPRHYIALRDYACFDDIKEVE